ncbi:MAG TPA: M20/M25/M40 family metallo-hydrolase [Pyrinomonadaceae bacterium]|jgi:hypothetical protein
MESVHSPADVVAAERPKRFGGALGLIALPLLALLAFAAVYLQRPGAVAPETAPATEFSAGRAMKHLRAVAQSPRPIGSAEHAAARDYILRELAAQGVAAEVQTATAAGPQRAAPYRVGTVSNVVGRIQGSGGQKSVLLVAHYDSVPTGPGASDDGAGVAALLETARALKAGPPLRNDVVFLFSDGEEVGLLGAEAFAAEHPLAKNVGVVLNFEARGNSGPAMMFETSPNNGRLIDEFARAAPRPVASSFSYEVYRRLPNDTDLTVFKRAGLEGMNFAYIGGLNHYHTALDSVGNLDGRSLQHHGDSALALAKHFGNLEGWGRGAGDDTYFNVLGTAFVHYPQAFALLLTCLCALLFAAVVVLGFKRRLLGAGGIGLGFVALLLGVVASAAVSALGWRLITVLRRDYQLVPWGDAYDAGFYVLAFALLTLAVVAALYNISRRWADAHSLAVGCLLLWLVLTLALSLLAPGGSYLFAWPLLFSLAALLVAFAVGGEGALKRWAVVALFCVPAVLLLSPVVYNLYEALSLPAAGVVAVLVALLLGLIIPALGLYTPRRSWALPALATLAAFCLVAAALLTARYDRNRPKVDSVFYVLEADSGRGMWATADRGADEWTSQFFKQGSKVEPLSDLFPFANVRMFLTGEAPAAALQAPEASLLADGAENGVRRLRLRITPKGGAGVLVISADPKTEVVGAALNGKAIKAGGPEGRVGPGRWGAVYYAPPAEGAELSLDVKGSGPVKLRVDARSYGLPRVEGAAFRPRPDYLVPAPTPYSDVTIVSKSFTF